MSERMSVKFRLREMIRLLLVAAAIFLAMTLVTHSPNDIHATAGQSVANAGGLIGAWCAYAIFAFFGSFSYLLPVLILYGILISYLERKALPERSTAIIVLRCIGVIMTFAAGSGLTSIFFYSLGESLPYGPGGVLGNSIYHYLLPLLSHAGSIILLIAAFLIGLTLFSGVSWLKFVILLLKGAWRSLAFVSKRASAVAKKKVREKQTQSPAFTIANTSEPQTDNPKKTGGLSRILAKHLKKDSSKSAHTDLVLVTPKQVITAVPDTEAIRQVKSNKNTSIKGLPNVSLLDDAERNKDEMPKAHLTEMAVLIEQRLADFGIKSKVVGVCPGPIVTRFELQLAPGTKVSKLSGLSKDLARSLTAHSVRIVEVIPGKPVVGLEVPNEKRQIVRLKEVLDSKEFHKIHSPLAMGLGKDIAGQPQAVNLAKMPHLLIAGTTGSGKSVGVNAMILSMLFKATPETLRLIMIDPKMLELSIYEGIPHLLTPVVTDMKEAANALRWCVREMERRYKVMASVGVRHIIGLNDKIRAAEKSGSPLKDQTWAANNPGAEQDDARANLTTMPYIVVVVDEFADMIMVVGKKVEELIARLAQKARAAGIHLILATQRPSVDVVTGLIKANIPSRISFQVSSKVDSRTIIDQMGAEQLIGYGDMLYLPAGTTVPTRIHGAFVADHEVHAVVNAWKERGTPEYTDSILSTESEDDSSRAEGQDAEQDALYDEAVQIVLETQRASISSVQRRLRIGYNRAARLLESMETAGMVSEIQSNGMREILVKS